MRAPVHPPKALAAILEHTAAIAFPMVSDPLTGALLRTLAASKPAGRFLELGTGTGAATAWLLDGMDSMSQLTTMDSDPAVQAIAKASLASDPRVTFLTADAAEFLATQAPQTYDLVFADAMPGKYESLEPALLAVKEGGFYVIDDMLPQPNWPPGHAPRAETLLALLSSHPDFTTVPMDWSTGLLLAVRKPVH